ncbi:MAG: aldo/keto reductase [Verrucomicrobiota bacterium]
MDITRTAFGTWSGGRFMHFGEPVSDDRFLNLIRHAYVHGIRTFMTADVYGLGQADEMLGRALDGLARDTYCLVGMVGHDIYPGKRDGSKGYLRFTDPTLRKPSEFLDYLKMAVEKQLQRCRATKLDVLLLHNPDSTGYSSPAVWKAMEKLIDAKLTDRVGIAPGPANGFTLDIIQCFERFSGLVTRAMIILNPLEPWPGLMCLPAAQKHGMKLITRVVDYGGLFHDDVKPGHQFGYGDHRTFRPAGWVDGGNQRMDRMRDFAHKHNLTMLQLACLWNLSHAPVENVVPTLIQEVGPNAKPIEIKVDELGAVGIDARLKDFKFDDDERRQILDIGNNKGCMELKGGNPSHTGEPLPDRWPLNDELLQIAQRWDIKPQEDLVCTHHTAKAAA